jgi:phage/plasmid-associated DNA primase
MTDLNALVVFAKVVEANSFSEAPRHADETRIKFITSQDSITARNLYGHYFDFFPTHKAAITTNHKPIIRGTDEGIWRRVHLVPFFWFRSTLNPWRETFANAGSSESCRGY